MHSLADGDTFTVHCAALQRAGQDLDRAEELEPGNEDAAEVRRKLSAMMQHGKRSELQTYPRMFSQAA
jgi:hypothetical protein